MTSTAHALVAGAIAQRFADPTTAAVLAYTSHFIMDSIPHWDWGTNWRSRPKQVTAILAIGETLGGLLLAYFVFRRTVPMIRLSLVVAAALIPDWMETPWYIFFARQKKDGPSHNAGVLEKFSYRIYKIQNYFHAKAPLSIGIFTQVATVAFFFFLLK